MYVYNYRVLEQVNFEKRFGELPRFNPDDSETGTPLPKSPRAIVNSYRRKRKLSVGEYCTHTHHTHTRTHGHAQTQKQTQIQTQIRIHMHTLTHLQTLTSYTHIPHTHAHKDIHKHTHVKHTHTPHTYINIITTIGSNENIVEHLFCCQFGLGKSIDRKER